jgi:hypothetical protein
VWRKLGLVCEGPGDVGWAISHAALPVVDASDSGTVRVYFSSRDAQGRSSIGAGDLDVSKPVPRLLIDRLPVLQPGALGTFDDSGVTSASLVRSEHLSHLYYTGWTRGVTVPFYLFAGLATSTDGRTFERRSAAPLLERNEVDPYLTASPWVLVDAGLWRMWYVSATKWTLENGQPKHFYHIRYADSRDGIHWRRDGTLCIDFERDEHAFGRPCVVRDPDCYRMWYSYRGDRYRIGYAESSDGVRWRRCDDRADIDVSPSGWDSEMQTYPAVFDLKGRRYMLYNGNGYGGRGLGMAVLETS